MPVSARVALLALTLFCAPFTAGAGCQDDDAPVLGKTEDQQTASDQTDSTAETSAEAVLVQALSTADPTATNGDELAGSAVDQAADELGSGCVVAVADKNIVTYTLTACTGPWGLNTVTGTVVATYTLAEDGRIQAAFQGTGLTINNSTGDWKATALRSVAGNVRTLEVSTDWKGLTADNRPTSRKGDYTAVLDFNQMCLGLDGVWNTKIGLVAWDTVVDAYSVCLNECPADGGSVTWTAGAKETVLVYDGSDVANWSNNNGASGTVNLACGM